MKRVLIAGAGSYIGESVKAYLEQWPEEYFVTMKETIGWNPKSEDFRNINIVFNAAGIAHIKETDENRHLYYEINRDLAVNIARKAKEAGVGQYVLLSSMAVYGKTVGKIRKDMSVNPINAYGKSKAEADEEITKLSGDDFRFACLRPPMVYGKGCKGNYQSLRKFALKSPLFPKYPNRRSMIYIGNLCEFVKEVIDQEKTGVFFPQNAEYVNTSKMVYLIAKNHGKRIRMTKFFNRMIKIASLNVIKKVFGNLVYEPVDRVSKYSFEESIKLTESSKLFFT